jgi:UDP-N-acetylglucosamine 2-epimerase (non-hydrolysing)
LLHTAQRGATVSDERVRQAIASSRKLVVATLHRRESHGAPLRRVAQALVELTRRHPGLSVVLPLHPSPRVLSSIVDVLEDCPDVILSAPLPYPEFVTLMNHADLIITDSGGIQEEAPSLGKPVLVVRDTTERPEAVHAGTARVVGTDPSLLIAEAGQLLDDEEAYRSMASLPNPFGDGRAALRSVAAIERLCQDRDRSNQVVVAGPFTGADGL